MIGILFAVGVIVYLAATALRRSSPTIIRSVVYLLQYYLTFAVRILSVAKCEAETRILTGINVGRSSVIVFSELPVTFAVNAFCG